LYPYILCVIVCIIGLSLRALHKGYPGFSGVFPYDYDPGYLQKYIEEKAEEAVTGIGALVRGDREAKVVFPGGKRSAMKRQEVV